MKIYALKIIGLGNRLRGDDGIGLCLALALRKCSSNSPPIEALELPTPGDAYALENTDMVIFLDAIDSSSLKAINIKSHEEPVLLEIDPGKLSELETVMALQEADSHTINPAYLTLYAYSANIFKGKAILIAIPVDNIEFGSGISNEAITKALKAANLVRRVIESLGGTLTYNTSCLEKILSGPCRDPLAPI